MTSLQTGMHYPIDLEALPPTWDKGYVGDFAFEIQPGFACGKHNKEGRGIPHIRPYNIDRSGKLDLSEIKAVAPDADTKRLHSGDVLFNNTNSPELIGKTTVISAAGEWGFSNHMTRVAFPDTVSPKFAAYQLHYLWSRGYFLHNCVKHVNQASVSSTTLARAVPFVKPPRPQQDCIVAEIEKQFSRLDEAVANLKRTKANLKRYKAAVLKAAVEGKLTEDWRKQHPNVEPASKLLERILAERSKKWNGRGKYKEPGTPDISNLPLLPKHWTYASIDSLLVEPMCNGISVKGSMTPPGVPALRLNAMTEEGFDYSKVRYIPINAVLAKELEVKAADFFVSRGNGSLRLVGRGTVAQIPPRQCVFPDTMIRLRIAVSMGTSRWISTIWPAKLIRRQIEKKVKTTAGIWKISQPELGSILLPVPPEVEQHQIVAEVERRLSVIDELEATVEADLTRADRLRQSVLGDAFSGKLVRAFA